jgi:FolB domain-containing protein
MDRNIIFLKDMQFMLSVGTDAWQRKGKVQPVHINVKVDQVEAIAEAALSDDVSKTLDYGKLYKRIQNELESQKGYENVEEVAKQVLLAITPPVNEAITPCVDVFLEIDLPKATLRAEGGLGYTINDTADPDISYKMVCIRGIKCACIIGVNLHERIQKQILIIDLTFRGDYTSPHHSSPDNNSPAMSIEPISEVSSVTLAANKYHEIIQDLVRVSQPLISTCTTSLLPRS